MKINKGSIGYRLLAPIFILVAAISLLLLVLVHLLSVRIQYDYQRFSVSAAANHVATVLDIAASEFVSAKLAGNPIVAEAKKRTVQEAILLAWSRSGQDGILAGGDGAVLISTLGPVQTRSIMARRVDGAFTVDDESGHYLCESRVFPLWGWAVITVTHRSTGLFAGKAAALLLPATAMGSLAIVTGLFFILRRNLQRPVTALVSAVNSQRTVSETGISEFDRIGEAINSSFAKLRDRTADLERELGERKKAETAVRKKEEHIRLLLGSTAEGIYGIDTAGVCTFCNPSGLRLLGYDREEDLLGKNVHELIHNRRDDGSNYPEGECRIYTAYRENKGVHADDEVFWRRDNTGFPVEYWSYPVEDQGTVTGAVVTFIDITERRRSEEFIRNILETVDEGFLIIDQDFTILSANQAYSRQAGRPLNEIVGRKCHEISHRRGAPCPDSDEPCSVRRVLETGKPCTMIHTHIGEGNVERITEVKAYPVRNSGGDATSVILTTVDITEKRRLEQQLNQAQKMEAIGQLAGGIAHDFNNVLTAIVGYASLLKKKAEAGGQIRLYAEQILEAASRAADLTRQILAFSRKQVIQSRPTDINHIVRGMEKFIARLLGEDIEIRTVLAAQEIPVVVDTGQMEQVLMNLAANARDAMPSGGILTVRTGVIAVDADAAVRYGLGAAGSYARLSVSDTGSGMDETTLSRAFEPFFTTKERGRGTGLGLSIVYGIVQQHSGQITVDSDPGKGTTFTIYLPLTRSAIDAIQAPADGDARGGAETILLAEDDPDVRGFIKLVLEDHGYTVVTAVDGSDAVTKFGERPDDIDLCLFDVLMPKKNGKAAFQEIRALRSGAKAVFMSGYAADIVREKDLLDEKMVLLNKPVLPRDLLRQVREVLDA